MLRIYSAMKGDSLMRLTIEGALKAEWVPLLEAECLRHLDARNRVELDFAGVGFIDRGGVAMVRRLVARGARVTQASGLVNALLSRPSGEDVLSKQSNSQGEI
jgi:ABC-type transporter Mla MlaB component